MFSLKDFDVFCSGIPLSSDTSPVSHLVLYSVILNSELEATDTIPLHEESAAVV
jgi:hypothetical protein